ncbi:PspC domain-containing protein [Antribacter sp. KLBMP9083]|uniref:PspC domain-containing protein n=1 Tax=Antribacter soli TaxID=2910976 RepID=A0AA41UD32_9MICO|nr:ATP-binding protein [Antribacter soli]MCF4122684.1 PspC domain-containing protein [Antribacter soli]
MPIPAPAEAPAAPTVRPPFLRPRRGRVLGGVAAGLAAHLGAPVGLVRLMLVLLTLAGGGGAIVYVFWWVTVPSGDPFAPDAVPTARQRLAPRLDTAAAAGVATEAGAGPGVGPAGAPGGYARPSTRFAPDSVVGRVRLSGPVTRLPLRDITIGVVLLSGAALLLAVRAGWDPAASWTLPAFIALGGLALAWSQLDARQRGQWLGMPGDGIGVRTRAGVLRLVGGILLVVVGVLFLVGQEAPLGALVMATVSSVAVLAGVALVLAPVWLRLVRELGDERAARAREAERADIAAHLHDSVLQTLALIRARADDPDTVSRMARAQERELREWLYDDRKAPGTSLAAELRGLVGDVEDSAAPTTIDAVVVGDCVPTDGTAALLQATREALVNAVAHGRPPVSVYLEVAPDAAEVFVRDRGDGFDLDDIAQDRFGVRESILGRVRRRGGSAEVESRPGWGTEVRLRMPLYAEVPATNGAARRVSTSSTNGSTTEGATS